MSRPTCWQMKPDDGTAGRRVDDAWGDFLIAIAVDAPERQLQKSADELSCAVLDHPETGPAVAAEVRQRGSEADRRHLRRLGYKPHRATVLRMPSPR
jgi:hypothetical protein